MAKCVLFDEMDNFPQSATMDDEVRGNIKLHSDIIIKQIYYVRGHDVVFTSYNDAVKFAERMKGAK